MENQENLLAKEKTTKQNRIWVRISAACNNKCIFCLDSDAQNGKLIEMDKVKKEIKEWYKQGYENRVIISWGEASINPKFPEYIQYAKEIGYDRIQTVTNGNMFANETFCKKVFSAGLQEVTFSFHWHTSSLHDYLVATPWAFKKSLKALIYIKKNYPKVIVNIDIVVNKVNVDFLPDIVKFFMKLWVYEYDILQIIPFGRGFSENKSKLFYKIEDHLEALQATWKLSKIPWMYMWTNRFPPQAFEGYEDLIQDPRKIKSEVMGEAIDMFNSFITSRWINKPHCFWDPCDVCFQNQYCHDFLKSIPWKNLVYDDSYEVISWEEFPSNVYEKYWSTIIDFKKSIHTKNKKLINIPQCLWGTWLYQWYWDLSPEYTVQDYTKKYILNLYRKKRVSCKKCIYNDTCKGIHLNFIRSYWFDILQPIEK